LGASTMPIVPVVIGRVAVFPVFYDFQASRKTERE
jgi:hypothetical protein